MNEIITNHLAYFIKDVDRVIDLTPDSVVKDISADSIAKDIAECFAAAIDNREPKLKHPFYSRPIYLELSNEVRKRNG